MNQDQQHPPRPPSGRRESMGSAGGLVGHSASLLSVRDRQKPNRTINIPPAPPKGRRLCGKLTRSGRLTSRAGKEVCSELPMESGCRAGGRGIQKAFGCTLSSGVHRPDSIGTARWDRVRKGDILALWKTSEYGLLGGMVDFKKCLCCRVCPRFDVTNWNSKQGFSTEQDILLFQKESRMSP